MSAFMNEGRGNGYNWDLGKSNNAVTAEDEGKYHATTIAKRYNIESMAVSELLPWTEWHHTSAAFNKTYYYDIEDVEANIEELKARSSEIRARRKKYLQDSHTFYNCTVTWEETVPDGRRFKDILKICKAKKVVGKGQTVTIYPADGGAAFKKRSCHVEVHSARGLDEKAGVLAESIMREGGKKSMYRLSLPVSADMAPYHNLTSISRRAAKSMAKKNMQIQRAFEIAAEEDREIARLKKNKETFKHAQQKQIKKEFLEMIKEVFGKNIEIITSFNPCKKTTLKTTNKIYSRDTGYFVRIGENYGVSAGIYGFNMKKVLCKYIDGEKITEIDLDGGKITGVKK